MSLAQMKFARLLTSTVIRRRPIPNSLFAPTAFHPGTIRLFSSKVIDGDDLDDYESLENPLKGRISKKKKLMYKRSQEELEKEKARKSGGGGGLSGKEKKTSETDGVENEEETLLSSLPQIAEPDEYLNSKEIDKRMIGLVIERHLNRFLVQRLLPRNSTESAVSNFPSQAALENLPKAKRVAVEYQRNLDIDHQYDDNDHDKKVAYNLNNFFLCYASSKMAFESHINLVPGDYVSYYTMKETPSAIKEAIDNTTHHLPQKQNETSSVTAAGKKQKRIPPYPSLPMNQYRPAWITDTLPRSNLFQRPSATSESRKKVVFKSIAANVTQLFILVATRPYVPLPTIDRYLITAKLFNIPKVHLIVNKYDLGEESRELYHELLFYEKILGTKILRTSIESEDGIDDIKNLLIGQTSIFVGQSGVGKSSLINLLFPHIAIKTNPLGGTSEQFGAHTTSNARLYHFYGSSLDDQTEATIPTVDDGQSGEQVTTPTLKHGVVIDSPGIREMGTWHLSLADIEFGFDEIYEFSKSCKYRNCNHLEYNGEENCAVVEAVNAGNIHEARYRSFLQLIKQIGYANDRR